MTVWPTKELREVADINYGYTDSATSDPVGPRFLRITDIRDDGVNWETVPYCNIPSSAAGRYKLADGDIVFARTGATTGKSFLIRDPPHAVFASYLIRLRLLNENLLPEFVSNFFQTERYWSVIQSGSTGSAQGGFNASKLGALRVPIPPLPEQKRIVAILDEMLNGIAAADANTEKNAANVVELFESYLDAALAAGGNGWVTCRLEDIVEKSCSLSYGIVQPGDEVADGLPIVRPTDLQPRVIGLSGLKRIDPSLAEGYRRTTLRGNELLVCVRGSTGVVSTASKELAGANVTRGIVPIRFDPDIVRQDLGYYIFISKNVQDQIKKATYGAALMQINICDLRKISLRVPPIGLQEGLVERISEIEKAVERFKSICQQKVAALGELKQAILKSAFAGNLKASAECAVSEAAE